jgi:hypothetical protein
MKRKPSVLLTVLLVSVVWLGNPILRNSPDVWAGARAENPEQDIDGDLENFSQTPGQIQSPTTADTADLPSHYGEPRFNRTVGILRAFLQHVLQRLRILW